MRKIKFRAWDKEKMIYRGSCDEYWCDFGNCKVYHTTPVDHAFYPIMQFTDLKDKNGKEVYEGDIVSIFKGCPSIVKFGVQDIGNDFQGVGFYTEEKNGSIFSIFGGGDIEVIGNIYENPELLES